MKSTTMLATLIKQGVAPSTGKTRMSNDNALAQSLFHPASAARLSVHVV